MATMRAWRFDSVKGGMIPNLRLKSNEPIPGNASTLGPDEVLIETATVTLKPADYKVPSFPIAGKLLCAPTPGADYSGRVSAVHPTNKDYIIGQRVFGRINVFELAKRTGALAEFLIAKRNECVPIPDSINFDDAAAIGTAGLTAFDSLHFGDLKGKKIFINGGSGGVGIFAIQIAKVMGAHVTTTCSTPNVTLCKELGADEVIDYKIANVMEVLKAGGVVYDLAIDNVGYEMTLLKNCAAFLKPKAQFVQVGGVGKTLAMGAVYAYLPCLRLGKNPVSMIAVKQSTEDLTKIANWMVEGKVKAVIDSTYSMEDGAKAYKHLATGRARGKIAVRVRDIAIPVDQPAQDDTAAHEKEQSNTVSAPKAKEGSDGATAPTTEESFSNVHDRRSVEIFEDAKEHVVA